MSKDWKFRRQTFYSIFKDSLTDKLEDNKIAIVENYDTIVTDAVNYAISHEYIMRYPGKSYSIAIHYASWLEDEFGVDFYETLDDPELLPDDPYFVRYSEDKETYDEILKLLDFFGRDIDGEKQPFLKMTREYFLQEFLLDEVGRSILP
jgi:hypothetical protein